MVVDPSDERKQFDLVCWDFGDTLCDETFMQIAPDGVPEWPETYRRCLAERPAWVDEWNNGHVSINDLVAPLAAALPMTPAQVARHLRAVWRRIDWFDGPMELARRLDGRVPQAIVTVNPWEFAGIAAATDLDLLFDVIVTSAELATESKPVMADRARELLGLPAGLSTTLLIDNRADNVEAFEAAGGVAHLYPGRPVEVDGFLAEMADRYGLL